MVTTHMREARLFYVTADDPCGPWSDPVFVETTGYVYDPSLDFIDGKTFLGFTSGESRNELKLGEIDIATGRWLVPPRTIWLGNGGFGAEGQHLYKIGSYYYLIDAEGGNTNQAMNCARSRDPYGPYESCPHNPVVSNKENRAHLLQCVGTAISSSIRMAVGGSSAMPCATTAALTSSKPCSGGKSCCCRWIGWTSGR